MLPTHCQPYYHADHTAGDQGLTFHLVVLVGLHFGYPGGDSLLLPTTETGHLKNPSIIWHLLNFSSFITTTQQQSPLALGISGYGPFFRQKQWLL